MFCDFSPVAKVNIVGECKFPKTHESKKTSEEQCLEKEIVMICWVGKVKDDFWEVGCSKCMFSFYGCAVKLKATFHGSVD